jgi:hypothetical protein
VCVKETNERTCLMSRDEEKSADLENSTRAPSCSPRFRGRMYKAYCCSPLLLLSDCFQMILVSISKTRNNEAMFPPRLCVPILSSLLYSSFRSTLTSATSQIYKIIANSHVFFPSLRRVYIMVYTPLFCPPPRCPENLT